VLQVGDLVKIKNDSFRSGQTGVVIQVNAHNEQLKVDVNLVRIDNRELWFTCHSLEVVNVASR
jgi:transcription antitermination factor NusG